VTAEEAEYAADTGQRVDFDYPDDEAISALAIFAGLIAWAGHSRARHAVIPVLLGQDKSSQGALARAVVVSKQTISRAMKEGRSEIARLTRRPSI